MKNRRQKRELCLREIAFIKTINENHIILAVIASGVAEIKIAAALENNWKILKKIWQERQGMDVAIFFLYFVALNFIEHLTLFKLGNLLHTIGCLKRREFWILTALNKEIEKKT